jgi:hypothetical protein
MAGPPWRIKWGLEVLKSLSEPGAEGGGGRGRKNLSELRSFRHYGKIVIETKITIIR